MIFAQQKVIIIDVGHGGIDPGAIGVNGVYEKDVVMQVANEILNLNSYLEKPLNIYLTRYTDTLISLSDRTKLAKTLNAHLFISLHCNQSDNPNARGIEIYVAKNKMNNIKKVLWFAFLLHQLFTERLGFDSRGVKFANFQVLRDMTNYTPSVLVELGFLSNYNENEYYNKPVGAQSMAKVILECLIKD